MITCRDGETRALRPKLPLVLMRSWTESSCPEVQNICFSLTRVVWMLLFPRADKNSSSEIRLFAEWEESDILLCLQGQTSPFSWHSTTYSQLPLMTAIQHGLIFLRVRWDLLINRLWSRPELTGTSKLKDDALARLRFSLENKGF